MRAFFILLLLLLAIHAASGFEAAYVEQSDSKLLKTIGFSVRFKQWEEGEQGLWAVDVCFRKGSKWLPENVEASISDDLGKVIYKSNNHLAPFVALTLPGFLQGKREKRFGFSFFTTEKLMKKAELEFWVQDSRSEQSIEGEHYIRLKDFFENKPE